MKRYILYTTSKAKWFKDEADAFAAEISKSKGRGEVVIAEMIRKVPKRVPLMIDSDSDVKPDWDWFSETFPRGDYDGVIFHFTPYYRKKWGIDSNLGGSANTKNKEYVEFWVCADQGDVAKGYQNVFVTMNGLSNFMRILFHEQAHFDENVDDQYNNILTQESVHDFDYRLKKIHQYHYLVDYRGQAIKEKIDLLTKTIIKFAKSIL